MAEPAVDRDDWETFMATYLRRRWRKHRLKLLQAPDVVINDQDIFRKSWLELHEALKSDFGSRLTDPQTVDFLQGRFVEIAASVGFAETTIKAQDVAAPCDSCEFRSEVDERDTDQINEKMPLKEILQRRCSQAPQLSAATKTCGRWTHHVENCPTFEVKRFMALEYDETNDSIKARNQEDLETATQQFEEWIEALNLSEQLLD